MKSFINHTFLKENHRQFSIWSLLRQAIAISTLFALSACGGHSTPSDSAESSIKQAAVLFPVTELGAGKSTQSVAPKVTLPSFTGHGWWWNPAEPGTGFAFEVQGTQAFVAFFMYDQATGAPVWYAASGAFDGSVFTSAMQRYQSIRQGPPYPNWFLPPISSSSPGIVKIEFSSNTRGLVTFPGGRQQVVERYQFATPDTGAATPTATNKPEAGWWWNEDHPGRGYAIERQGNDIFVAAFHYDLEGVNTWNVVSAKLDTNVSAINALFQSAKGGQSLTGAWRAASFNSNPATADLIFASPCEAVLRLPGYFHDIRIRKYNFGGNDARCRSDIATAANLPDLAQCYAVAPGVKVTLTAKPSIATSRASNGRVIGYEPITSELVYSAASFQGRPTVKMATSALAPMLPLGDGNPYQYSTQHEFTPTSWSVIWPGSTDSNRQSAPVNTSSEMALDTTVLLGGRQAWVRYYSTSVAGEANYDTVSRVFASRETLVTPLQTFNNVCKINLTERLNTNIAATAVRSITRDISSTLWYAPGYGYVKGVVTTRFYDGRSPNLVTYTNEPTFVSR